MAFYTRQITFKVSQAVATQLDKLGTSKDLSRNLVAKELVIAALNGEPVPQSTFPENAEAASAADGKLLAIDSLPPVMQRATSVLGDAAIAKLLSELRELRGNDIAALRKDIRRLGKAFFCQAGLEIDAARDRTDIIFGAEDG